MKEKRKTFFLIGILTVLTLSGVILVSGFGHSKAAPQENKALDWPQWRGPNRNGLSFEKELANRWPKPGSEVLWRKSVGEGYSGVAVSNSRLFSMWDEGNSQYLVCMDAQNGKEIWRYKIGNSYKDGWGNGPRSTPVIDDSRVFVTSAHGNLHAVSISDGKAIWTHDLPAEYGGRIPDHGYSSSPLIEGEKLFVEVGGKSSYSFVAFDKSTGKVVWHTQTDEPSYSSPIAVTINNSRQIVFLSAAGLFSLSPEDGSLHWQYDWEARCPATKFPTNSATPIFIAPDKIFISGGYGTVIGAAVVQVQKQGEQFSVKELWNNKVMKNVINSSVFFENHIYGFDNNQLACVDALTGELKWKTRGFQRGSLIAADGHLIVLGERGKLALVETSPEEFKEISSMQILDGICWSSPSLANGKLYLRNHEEMICFNFSGK
jgi:outer membrane protein assembly factor BamB